MTIYRQGLLQLGTTVLPVSNVSLNPAIASQARQSAGDQAPTQQTVFGSSPSFTATVPLVSALDLIGLKCTRFTDLQCSLLRVDPTTGITAADTSHVRFALDTGAVCYAVITDFSAAQGAIATANIQVWCISDDGVTNPVSVTTGSALALSAQPALHTLGPVDINASEVSGASSVSGSLNHNASVLVTDGDLYPTQYSWRSTNPTLTVQHSDPDAVLDAATLDGANISASTKVTFRARGSDGIITTTEKTISLTSGHIITQPLGGDSGQIAGVAYTILPEASNATTHPWTVS